MPGVQGLQGLAPVIVPTVVQDPGVTLDPSVMGGPYNPAHGLYEWGDPVPWVTQQGVDVSGQAPTVEGSLVSQVPGNAPADQDPTLYADSTSTGSHGAPWPFLHIPDSGAVNSAEVTAVQSAANQELHGYDDGTAASFTNQPVPGHKMRWNLQPDYNTSGAMTGSNVGDLAMNNGTGRDRFAGDVVAGDNLNEFGMDAAHIHRQNPAGHVPVPLDTTMGAQRPMVMNIPGRYGSYPVGGGSPFQGQIPGVGNNFGAAEIGVASDYTPPPDSPTNPPLDLPTGPPVWGVTGLGF